MIRGPGFPGVVTPVLALAALAALFAGASVMRLSPAQHMERITRRANIPMVRFHDRRHTAATLLLGRGIHPKILSEMLGHANIAVTLDTYSHVTPTMMREAAEAMDAILARRPKSSH